MLLWAICCNRGLLVYELVSRLVWQSSVVAKQLFVQLLRSFSHGFGCVEEDYYSLCINQLLQSEPTGFVVGRTDRDQLM